MSTVERLLREATGEANFRHRLYSLEPFPYARAFEAEQDGCMETNSRSRPLVLVVEDEPIAREVACGWLDELGYDSVCAESAAGALALLKERHCDVLFTDIHLQGKPDGFQLAVSAVDRQPSIRTLFVSALAWGRHQVDDPGTTFLHKPYSKAELARALGVVLEG